MRFAIHLQDNSLKTGFKVQVSEKDNRFHLQKCEFVKMVTFNVFIGN